MTERRPTSSQFIGGGAPLQLSTTVDGETALVAAIGELDRETAPKLASELLAHTDRDVDLDLSGIGFMDSQGLRVLMEARKAAGDETTVRITQASDQVRRLLDMTGLREMFGLS